MCPQDSPGYYLKTQNTKHNAWYCCFVHFDTPVSVPSLSFKTEWNNIVVILNCPKSQISRFSILNRQCTKSKALVFTNFCFACHFSTNGSIIFWGKKFEKMFENEEEKNKLYPKGARNFIFGIEILWTLLIINNES